MNAKRAKCTAFSFGAPRELERELATAVSAAGAHPMASLPLEREPRVLPSEDAQIVLVFIDADPEIGFDAIRHLSAQDPERPVLVVSAEQGSDSVLRAMRAGARDFAVLDAALEDLGRAVREALHARAAPPPKGQGKVVSFLGAKGGAGATTLATNLAALARLERGAKVVLLDLDLQLGDCLAMLDIDARSSIAATLRSLDRLDEAMLEGLVAVHPGTGIHVLSQSDSVEDLDEVTPKRVARLIAVLRRHYDLVVIDGLRAFDELALTALDESAPIAIVLTPEVPAIKNARRCLQIFERLEYAEDRLRVVINRQHKKDAFDADTIGETLRMPVACTVGNDFPRVSASINRGRLIAEDRPRARVTRDLDGLLDAMLGPREPARSPGLLGNLFRGRRRSAPPNIEVET